MLKYQRQEQGIMLLIRMRLTKILKMNPREIAQVIVDEVEDLDILNKVEVVDRALLTFL